MIMDRQGEVLVANRPSYELVVELEDVTDIPSLASRLGHPAAPGRPTAPPTDGARETASPSIRRPGDLTWESSPG